MSKKLGQYYDVWINPNRILPPSNEHVLITVGGFVDANVVMMGYYSKEDDKWVVEFGAWSKELYIVAWSFKPEPAIKFGENKGTLKSGRAAYDQVMRRRIEKEFIFYGAMNLLAILVGFLASVYNLGPFDAKEPWTGFFVLVLPAIIVTNIVSYLIVEKYKDAYP